MSNKKERENMYTIHQTVWAQQSYSFLVVPSNSSENASVLFVVDLQVSSILFENNV